MKKKLLFILLPVFTFACLILLASCDAYGGSYKEVTGEELTAVETKLNNCAAQQETDKTTNYEVNVNATVKMSVSGGTMEATISGKTLYDRSSSDNKASYYSKYDMKINSSEGNITIVTETWQLSDGMVYLNASMNGKSGSNTYNTSIKKKGTAQSVYNDTDAEYMAIQSMMSSFTSALTETNSMLDLSEIAASLKESGVKVYTAGDNKIKIEATEDNDTTLTFYIIVNSNNTFQMKFEMPETKMGGLLGGMTLKSTAEMKPTSAKVTAPSGNYEEV